MAWVNDYVKDFSNQEMLQKDVFDEKNWEVKVLTEVTEKQINDNVEVSFQNFLNSTNLENMTDQQKQEYFNTWLDTDVTKILDSEKINDIKKVNSNIETSLKALEFSLQLGALETAIQQQREWNAEAVTLNSGITIEWMLRNQITVDKLNTLVGKINSTNFKEKKYVVDCLNSWKKEDIRKIQYLILWKKDEYQVWKWWNKEWDLSRFWTDWLFWNETYDALTKYITNNPETQPVEQNNTPVVWEKSWVDENLQQTIPPVDGGETTNSGTDDDIEVSWSAWNWWAWTTTSTEYASSNSDSSDDEIELTDDDEQLEWTSDVEIVNNNPNPDDYEDVSVDDDTEVESESWTDLPDMWNVEILYEWIAYNVDKESLQEVDSDEKAVKLMTTARVGLLMKKAFSIIDVNYKPRWQELKDLRKVKQALLDCDNPVDLFNDFFNSYNNNESYSSDNKKLNKLYNLYKEYKDDQNGNKKWPYFKKLMWLLEKYFVQWINDENWKRIETFKDLYNNELLWLNKEIKIKKKKTAERKANKNMTDEERKLFNEWWWTALDSLNTKKIMELSSESLKEFKDKYPEFKSLDELQFALTLSDMNADGRVDSQDFDAKTGQEVWSLYRDAMVDEKYGVIENWPMKNLVDYATNYAELMWYENTAKFLKWIDTNRDNAKTIMDKIKNEKPLVMQYFRSLLANSPKWAIENIFKYGYKETKTWSQELWNGVTNEMIAELMKDPDFEKKYNEVYNDLVQQWLNDTPEIKNSLRPIIAGAFLCDPSLKNPYGWWLNVWLAKSLWKNWKWWNIWFTLWVATLGDTQTVWIAVSYGKSFNLGDAAKLNASATAWAYVSWWIPVVSASSTVWMDIMINKQEQLKTLDVTSANYIWIAWNIWVWFDLKNWWIFGWWGWWSLSVMKDRMWWIERTYQNIKNTIWDVLKDAVAWDSFANKDNFLAKTKEKLKEKYPNTTDEQLTKGAQNIYAWLAYYLLGVNNPSGLTDQQKSNILLNVAECYAQQWRNQAIKDLEWKVEIDRATIWLQIIAGLFPMPVMMIWFEWYTNMYAHESKESMENYAYQLASGNGMKETVWSKKPLYEYSWNGKDGWITQEWLNYLNEKMSIIESRMNVPNVGLKTLEFVDLANGYKNAVRIPKDLYKYVNINISRELKNYMQMDNDWNILIPHNVPISLMTYSRANTARYTLMIWDNKVNSNDIYVWPDTKFNGNINSFEWIKWEVTPEDINKRLSVLWGDSPIASCLSVDNGFVTLKTKANCNIELWDGITQSNDVIVIPQNKVLNLEKLSDMSYKASLDAGSENFRINYYPEWMYNVENSSNTITVSIDSMSNNPEIDILFTDIENKFNSWEYKRWNGAYATFMNAAYEAWIDNILDEDDYADVFDKLKILLSTKLNDSDLSGLKSYMERDDLSWKDKALIVDKFKALFSYNHNLINKSNLYLQLKDRGDHYKNLKWYDTTVEFPLTSGIDYRQNVQNQLNQKNTFQREVNPNLIWMTAFYKLWNNSKWRSYMMTEIGWTNVLWWVTEDIAWSDLEATKNWFTANLDKSVVHKEMIKSALLSKINEQLSSRGATEIGNLSDAELKSILLWKSVDISQENVRLSLSMEPKYVFYLLWECANESIWVILDNITVNYTNTITTWSTDVRILEASWTREWLFVDSVEASNNLDLRQRNTFTLWAAAGIKKEKFEEQPKPKPEPEDHPRSKPHEHEHDEIVSENDHSVVHDSDTDEGGSVWWNDWLD